MQGEENQTRDQPPFPAGVSTSTHTHHMSDVDRNIYSYWALREILRAVLEQVEEAVLFVIFPLPFPSLLIVKLVLCL